MFLCDASTVLMRWTTMMLLVIGLLFLVTEHMERIWTSCQLLHREWLRRTFLLKFLPPWITPRKLNILKWFGYVTSSNTRNTFPNKSWMDLAIMSKSLSKEPKRVKIMVKVNGEFQRIKSYKFFFPSLIYLFSNALYFCED